VPCHNNIFFFIFDKLNETIFQNKMANYNGSNQTVLIDEPSALIGGTFALLIAILGITVNSVTMYVILARKSIRLVFL
jgi:hypothetical protein